MTRELEQEASLSNQYPVILRQAAFHGRVSSVRKLLELGADPGARDRDGFTPKHLAAQRGHLDVVKALIDAGAARCSGQ